MTIVKLAGDLNGRILNTQLNWNTSRRVKYTQRIFKLHLIPANSTTRPPPLFFTILQCVPLNMTIERRPALNFNMHSNLRKNTRKGTVNEILTDPLLIKGYVQLIIVPFKPSPEIHCSTD